jgi:hypothetical protein
MVNVWRAIGASAERFPLAVANGRTVPPADYIGVDIVYPDRTGEISQNAHSAGRRWYYFSNMQRNEAMLLKCFDSATDARARYTRRSRGRRRPPPKYRTVLSILVWPSSN